MTLKEYVCLCSDRDDESFKGYLAKMPWWALPFDDASKRTALLMYFELKGIQAPCFELKTTLALIVLSANGEKIINSNGIMRLLEDPTGADFPWAARPVEKLPRKMYHCVGLFTGRCFVLFTDDLTPAGVQRAEELMMDAALPHFMMDEPKADFYIADSTSLRSCMMMRGLVPEEASMPQLVFFGRPKLHVLGPLPKDSATVTAFVTGCLK